MFSLKIRVEIRFNNVLDRKETTFFFNYIKKNFQSVKKRIFLKGLTHAFGQEIEFFYYLFSSSIRVEIRLNNVLQSPKKSLFSKWVKNAKFFLYFDLVKIRLEIMLNNFVEKKENFSSKKRKIL